MFHVTIHDDSCQQLALLNAPECSFGIGYGPYHCVPQYDVEIKLCGVEYVLHIPICMVARGRTYPGSVRETLFELGHELVLNPRLPPEYEPRMLACMQGEFGRCYVLQSEVDRVWKEHLSDCSCVSCGRTPENEWDWIEWERRGSKVRFVDEILGGHYCSPECVQQASDLWIKYQQQQHKDQKCLVASRKALKACRKAIKEHNPEALRLHRQELQQALSSLDS